jgi:predicted DNA-binding protein (MmcQ/YjbR family)
MPKAATDARRTRVSKICLSLPEATCEISGDHAIFRIRKKPFAYYMNNHHGDGIVCVAAKVGPGDNKALVAAQPKRFCLPAYIASRGWVSLRLDTGEIDWDEVRELAVDSYRRIAPTRLAAMVEMPSE